MMGEIFVEELGVVEIQGSTPTPEEQAAIISAIQGVPESPAPAGLPSAPRPTGGAAESVERPPLITREGFVEGARRAVEPAMVTAGAGVGGLVGIPAGAVGVAGGAAGGAALGELAFQQLNDFLRMQGLEPLPGAIPPGPASERIPEGLKRASGEALLEVGTLGAATVMRPVKDFLTPAVGKIMGVRTDAAKEMQRLAARQGVELAAVDVGGAVPRGLAKTLGIFPFTGGPLRQQEVSKRGQELERVEDILNTFAPTSTTAATLSMDMFAAAQRVAKEFKSVTSKLYDNFRQAGRNVKDINGDPLTAVVPTEDTRKIIGEFVEEFRLGQIEVQTPGGETQILRVPETEDFKAFLELAENLPERISVDQWAALEDSFESFVSSLPKDNFILSRVVPIKMAMEADLDNIFKGMDNIDPETMQAIVTMKQEADTLFSTGMALFQRPTGQKLARVDRRLFRPGAVQPGSANPDELFKPVFNANSAEALKDLRKIVGTDVFRRGVRRKIEDAFEASFNFKTIRGDEMATFDINKFATNLGLVDGLKDRTDALREMLKGSGVSVDDLQEFVKNVRITSISDPSTFIMRRATLGGIAGLKALGGLGTAAGGFKPSNILVLTALARGLSQAMANPSALKKLTRAFGPNLDAVQRQAVLARFIREIGSDRGDGPPSPRPQ